MDDSLKLAEPLTLLPDEYRNYKQERRNRQVPFHPSSAGTIRYQQMPMCGHKLIVGGEPRHRNCPSCWFVTFNLHKDLVESCDEVFKQFGESGLRQIKGPKFAKNFTRFMSTLASWKKIQEKNGEDSTTAAPGCSDTADGAGDEAVENSLL